MSSPSDAGKSWLEPRPITAAETRPLRQAMLRPHQPSDASIYPDDDHSAHFGVFAGPELIGVASIFEESRQEAENGWRIRGMAVLPEHRGQGHGGALLDACLEHARSRGGVEAWCNARSTAAPFYARHGFEIVGEEFDLPPIGPHYLMRRSLADD